MGMPSAMVSPGCEQVVLAQAVEQVGHGGGAALDRVHVEGAHEGVGADHLLVDVLAHDDLAQSRSMRSGTG
jgi:hypothetical protein